MKNTQLTTTQKQAVAASVESTAYSIQQVLGQVALIQQIMRECMQEGHHYGKIPGCGDKPTLLKPGAEKLCLTFRYAPAYDIEEKELSGEGHREYRVKCSLTSILTGVFVGQGVGICSTMEAKYRYRGNTAELTDRPVPRAYWDIRQDDPAKAQELIGGKGFSPKKENGVWMIAKAGDKAEHDNIADVYNTVLKMAKKRALVDAVLTATAASDIFTQDLEDMVDKLESHTPEIREAKRVAASIPKSQPAEVREVESESVDKNHQDSTGMSYLETRIHFGRNRGLMLSELTPQQVAWYLKEWMPNKEVNGPTSEDDLILIRALKSYQNAGGK